MPTNLGKHMQSLKDERYRHSWENTGGPRQGRTGWSVRDMCLPGVHFCCAQLGDTSCHQVMETTKKLTLWFKL